MSSSSPEEKKRFHRENIIWLIYINISILSILRIPNNLTFCNIYTLVSLTRLDAPKRSAVLDALFTGRLHQLRRGIANLADFKLIEFFLRFVDQREPD